MESISNTERAEAQPAEADLREGPEESGQGDKRSGKGRIFARSSRI